MGRQHYQNSLELFRRSEVVRGQGRALIGEAAASLDLGDIDKARELLNQVQPLVQQAADPAIDAASAEQLARLAFADAAQDEGQRLLHEADRLRARARRPRGALAARDAQTLSVG